MAMNFDELKKEMFASFFINFFYIMMIANLFQHYIGVGFLIPADVFAITIMAGLICLVDLALYSKRELRRAELVVRHLISLILGIAVVLGVARFMGWLSWDRPVTVIAFLSMALIGYVVSVVIDFFRTKHNAAEMTKKINELNQ